MLYEAVEIVTLLLAILTENVFKFGNF